MSRKAVQIQRSAAAQPQADQPQVDQAPSDRPPTEQPQATPAQVAAMDAGSRVLEADVDGRRVRIVAQDEIVFECGQASVTLRANGRIIIRGTYVETHSEGTNRIKGGQVRIN
jgi:hypothetical protein